MGLLLGGQQVHVVGDEELAAFQKAGGVATRYFMFSMGCRVAELWKHCIRAFDLAKMEKVG